MRDSTATPVINTTSRWPGGGDQQQDRGAALPGAWLPRPRVLQAQDLSALQPARQSGGCDPGYWEYSAIVTNLPFPLRRLWHFMCGRGAHEKLIGELKSALAFDSVPTNHHGANSAWQQLVGLAHNLLISFQTETGAPRRRRSTKSTALHVLRSLQTLRFELFHRAGERVRPHGLTTLCLPANPELRRRFERMARMLPMASEF